MNATLKSKSSKSVGENIRAIRQQKGWSQEEVAHKLGISIPALSKIETAVTDVNLSRLEQIADIYEISISKLFTSDAEELKTEVLNRKYAKMNSAERDAELTNLQRKVISLYEELRGKTQVVA